MRESHAQCVRVETSAIACLLDHVLEEHCEPLVELGGDLRTRESLLSLVVDCNKRAPEIELIRSNSNYYESNCSVNRLSYAQIKECSCVIE